jgi:hypothetical protein
MLVIKDSFAVLIKIKKNGRQDITKIPDKTHCFGYWCFFDDSISRISVYFLLIRVNY